MSCEKCAQLLITERQLEKEISRLKQALADAKREGVREFLEWMFKLNGVEFGRLFGMFANKKFDEIIQKVEAERG